MGNPNRHIKYRRSVYRKNRIKLIVLSTAVSLVLVSVVFLIIGNILGDKVEEGAESRKKRETADTVAEHKLVPDVYAHPVPLFASDSTLSNRISAAKASGYTAASFYLDSADGRLTYSSPTAQSLGKQTEDKSLNTLTGAAELFSAEGIYTVGITNVSAFKDEDDLARASAIGYHAALIAEALRAGIDDVLIYVGEIPTERYAELIRLCEEVRRLCPDKGNIGLALMPSFFTQPSTDGDFEELWEAFDYIALDLSAPPTDTSLSAHADTSLGNMIYYLLRYNIRVALPSSDPTLSEAVAVANGKGSQNIILLP